MAMATSLPSASTAMETLVRSQQDAMRTLRTFVDALRDVKKEELVDAEVRQAIRSSGLPLPTHGDGDGVLGDADLLHAASGLTQAFGQLVQAMKHIDELEAAQQQQQTPRTRSTRADEKPQAPAGLLSLRDYSVLQAALELFFCWVAFPSVDDGLLLPLDKRRPTKTLAISRHVLAWGSHATEASASGVVDIEATGRHVVDATRSMLQLLLLPQIQPILLPKYVVEVVALLVYGEIYGDFEDATREQSKTMLASLLRVLPLRLSMTSLRAALGQTSGPKNRVVTVFKRRCGTLLTQLTMEDGGVLTTIEMLLGAVDEGNTQARMQVATLICQCPANVEPSTYARSLGRQVRGLFNDANRQNKLLVETAVVLINEMATRYADALDAEILAYLFKPLLKYDDSETNEQLSPTGEAGTENEIADCVALLSLLLCGPPPSPALVLALVPVFRPLVHLCGFAMASKSFLATGIQGILIAFIKVVPSAALLLQVSVLPVTPPLRARLQNCGFQRSMQASSWTPRNEFAAGGSGGIALRQVSNTVEDDDNSTSLRLAVAAIVEVLGSKELETSTVVGELFASLLLTYMRVRKPTNDDDDDAAARPQANDSAASSELALYETVKAPRDALGVEITLSLLLAIIESLGPSVLRSAETVLRCLTIVLGMFANSRVAMIETTTAPATDNEDEDEDDEVLTICLGLVMTILEAGSVQRSEAEEAELRSMLPVLEELSQYPRPQIAELATDARVSILSRGASVPTTGKPAQEPSFSQTLREAAADLQSSLVPLRARGVVTLTKLVRRSQSHRGDKEWTPRITQLMEVFMNHLVDSESYVFLAAVQGLSALADAHPDTAIPMLTASLRDKSNALEKRIKLSEALLFTAKRCGETLPKYAKTFVYSYLECIRAPPRVRSTQAAKKSFSLIEEIDAEETSAATVELTDEEREAHVQAANTALTEATLRASCLSNLAEVSAMLQWSLAPFAADVLSCVFGILQLELDMSANSVVAVRRGAVFLLKYVFELMGHKVIEVLPDQLKPMYHTLKHVERVDKDDVVRFHAQQALRSLDEIMRAELFPQASVGDDALGGGLRALRIVKHY